MIRIIKILPLALLILCISLNCCKKESQIENPNELHSADFRDNFIGTYDCFVIAKITTQDSNGVFITDTNIYLDTLLISKSSDSTKIEIHGGPNQEVEMNINDSTFTGYHLSGHFYFDSIYLYYFITPAALSNFTYREKRYLN